MNTSYNYWNTVIPQSEPRQREMLSVISRMRNVGEMMTALDQTHFDNDCTEGRVSIVDSVSLGNLGKLRGEATLQSERTPDRMKVTVTPQGQEPVEYIYGSAAFSDEGGASCRGQRYYIIHDHGTGLFEEVRIDMQNGKGEYFSRDIRQG